MAKHLHQRGADINWIGWDELTPLDTAKRNNAHDIVEWLTSLGARSNRT